MFVLKLTFNLHQIFKKRRCWMSEWDWFQKNVLKLVCVFTEITYPENYRKFLIFADFLISHFQNILVCQLCEKRSISEVSCISYPLLRTCIWAHQGLRNVRYLWMHSVFSNFTGKRFPENLTIFHRGDLLNEIFNKILW